MKDTGPRAAPPPGDRLRERNGRAVTRQDAVKIDSQNGDPRRAQRLRIKLYDAGIVRGAVKQPPQSAAVAKTERKASQYVRKGAHASDFLMLFLGQ